MAKIVLNEFSPTFSFASWDREPSIATGSVSASFSGGFLFYSNNPESVTPPAIADSGCWLNRQQVSGNGQIYTWHQNDTGNSITSAITIYNPNNFTINVNSSNWGQTSQKDASDSNAWINYLNEYSPISITIGSYGYGTIFNFKVAPGHNFGVVARINITSTLGYAADAVIFDLAYQYDSSATSKFAELIGDKECGLGYGYYNILDFGTIDGDSSIGRYHRFGYYGDDSGGNDLVTISGGNSHGKIECSYGQQLVVRLSIRNPYSYRRTFRVSLGSRGGAVIPVVNGYGGIGSKGWVSAYNAVDLIEIDIDSGSTEPVEFTLMICAISAAPLYLGARVV
ncbi:hypothetical protein [Paenibacillus tyrfis]|uniref:hypothetical protein n=1 Tax=Paenibacillus tyrfis TaxID=1501230 RepID=UPI00209EF521|nr:hypothetical protein [Paenibacillus tyrfis]MCP1311357.1 hypothetical protein [Paenibacillus tyrfis]